MDKYERYIWDSRNRTDRGGISYKTYRNNIINREYWEA